MKYQVDEEVVVVDSGFAYLLYEHFLEEKGLSYLRKNFRGSYAPKENIRYKIIDAGRHANRKDVVYIIQDQDTEQIFLISERGLTSAGKVE